MRKEILLNIAACFAFACVGMLARWSSSGATVFQTVFLRSLMGIVLVTWYGRIRNISLLGVDRPALLRRGLLGAIGLTLFHFALSRLPVGNVMVLAGTSPIWVAILSPWIVRERTPRYVFVLLPVFVCGLVFIARPNYSEGWKLIPSLAALSNGLLSAVVLLTIRSLRKTDGAVSIVFYFMTVLAVLSFPLAIADLSALSLKSGGLLLLAGVFAFLAQMAMTNAYQLGRASTISVFNYSSPLFGYLLGVLFLNELPNFRTTIGALLIIVAGIMATLLARRA